MNRYDFIVDPTPPEIVRDPEQVKAYEQKIIDSIRASGEEESDE